jgi:hypothetical protein
MQSNDARVTGAVMLALVYVWHEHATLFRGASRVIREHRLNPSRGSAFHRLVLLALRLHASRPESGSVPTPSPLLTPRH